MARRKVPREEFLPRFLQEFASPLPIAEGQTIDESDPQGNNENGGDIRKPLQKTLNRPVVMIAKVRTHSPEAGVTIGIINHIER